MKRFSALLEQLAFEPARIGKLRLLQDYLRNAPDPDRGYALAAITGELKFTHAKAGLIRKLIAERTDEVLFVLSYDFVGDLSETAALLWPEPDEPHEEADTLPLSAVIDTLTHTGKAALPGVLAGLLDRLDESGRWALLKLITGGLRIGVSARLARTAIAANAADHHTCDVNDIEDMWPSLEPPYTELLAWMDGKGSRPAHKSALVFRPAMLAHALEEKDLEALDPAHFAAEWKWDGIRIQAGLADGGARLYSRTGENIGETFPDLAEALAASDAGDFVIDGELLIVRDGRVESFATLQQRLNRKKVTPKLVAEFPAHIIAYDLLARDGYNLRSLDFGERRAQLETFVREARLPQLTLSPQIDFADWEKLTAARAYPLAYGAGDNAPAVEGVMLKRLDAPYVPGRPKGLWYKWKRDPFLIDAVLMYAQRGHGKRSSLYSDFTFGVWKGESLVPVGKAYFGFTDAELKRIDKFVRDNTLNRFGPVREVATGPEEGLVLEIAFDGLNRSPRHKSGLAMRFPRISRLRWDKPAREADRIEALEALLGEQTDIPKERS